MNSFMYIDTPIGRLYAAASEKGISQLGISARDGVEYLPEAQANFPFELAKQLREYFAGARSHFDLPLAVSGTAFQREVYAALVEIPYGEVITYSELARRVDRPKAARAVGGANGRNPLLIIIPCHRVVAANGLGGYSAGLERKKMLLALEGARVI